MYTKLPILFFNATTGGAIAVYRTGVRDIVIHDMDPNPSLAHMMYM